jgi:hypothetical protein
MTDFANCPILEVTLLAAPAIPLLLGVEDELSEVDNSSVFLGFDLKSPPSQPEGNHFQTIFLLDFFLATWASGV